MIRKTLTILSLIGLLLSVGLWGVSYWHPYFISERYTFWVSMGCLNVIEIPSEVTRRAYGNSRWRTFRSFHTIWLPSRLVPPYIGFWMPLWIPTVFFATCLWWSVLPIHRHRKRKKLGLCVKCGYDLRASKDRCPECGESILR